MIIKLFLLLLFPGNDAEICQIAATDAMGDINVYVMPKHGISAGSSTVHILFVMNKGLVYNGQPTDSLAGGVSKFFDWLKARKPYILLAHSGKSFDGKHLIKAWITCGNLEEYPALKCGVLLYNLCF